MATTALIGVGFAVLGLVGIAAAGGKPGRVAATSIVLVAVVVGAVVWVWLDTYAGGI